MAKPLIDDFFGDLSAFRRYDVNYTKKECTERRHDLNFILKQARDVLDDKTKHRSQPLGLCLNKVPICGADQLFTTAAASVIIDDIVHDSLYYGQSY